MQDQSPKPRMNAGKTPWLDRVEARLFAGQRRSQRDGDVAAQPRPRPKAWLQPLANGAPMVLIGFSSVALLICFVFAVSYYSTTYERMIAHPQVYDLISHRLVTTRVHFGTPACAQGDDRATDPSPCYTAATFDDGTWAALDVPKVDFAQMPDFRDAVADNRMVYRFHVQVPDALRQSGDPLGFSPGYINHIRYRIFVNGRLIEEHLGAASEGAAASVGLSAGDYADGHVVVTLVATASAKEPGIYHGASLMLGPKREIDASYVLQERSLYTYFLLFLLTKGSIFVVFGLFFMFSKDRRALFYFLVFGFCVTFENFLAGNFIVDAISRELRVSLFYMNKTLASAGLLAFIVEYFQAYRIRQLARRYIVATFAAVGLGLADFLYGTGTATGGLIFRSTSALFWITLIAGIGIGLLAIRQWHKAGIDRGRVRLLSGFVAVMTVYLGLLTWEFFFNEMIGFDKRAVFDLIFFYFMAFLTAREFGFNQGQIITLEAHMIEKRRMEQELQEASAIAKAFVPGGTPDWPSWRIAVHHQPLSESSGDWYAFEASPSGQWGHIIMCDITGHGVQAALVVSTCRSVLSAMVTDDSAATERCDFLEDYAHKLNTVLCRQGAGNHVTTLLGLTINRDTGSLYYVTAGHPVPLLVTKSEDGKIDVKGLLSRFNVLGVDETNTYKLTQFDLPLGAEVFAYTDGLPLNSRLKELKQYLRGRTSWDTLDPHDLFQFVRDAEAKHRSGLAPDDVSLIWLKRAA